MKQYKTKLSGLDITQQ